MYFSGRKEYDGAPTRKHQRIETVYITVYCRKLVCTQSLFRHVTSCFFYIIYDFFKDAAFVLYKNSIAASWQYYSISFFILFSFMMASHEQIRYFFDRFF